MSSSFPLVVTVILNTNRRADTLEALQSLAGSDYPHHKVIVLDNASTDGSAQAIQAGFPEVALISLDSNLGYAGNNNVGIKVALEMGADWVFVLNEDTLLAPDCIRLLVEQASSDAGVGVLGPMVYHHNEPGVIQSAGGKLDRNWNAWHLGINETDRGQFDRPHQVDWISGCAILFRRDVIEQIGMLDARFFYYYEETEWCLRARRAGWKILHVPQAHLWHKGVQRDYQPGPNVTYYGTRNRFLMMNIHQAPISVWIAVWARTLLTVLSWSIRPKWRSRSEHRDAMLQAVRDYLSHQWGMRKTRSVSGNHPL